MIRIKISDQAKWWHEQTKNDMADAVRYAMLGIGKTIKKKAKENPIVYRDVEIKVLEDEE